MGEDRTLGSDGPIIQDADIGDKDLVVSEAIRPFLIKAKITALDRGPGGHRDDNRHWLHVLPHHPSHGGQIGH